MPTDLTRIGAATDAELAVSNGARKIYLIAILQNQREILQLDEVVETVVDLDCQLVNHVGRYTINTSGAATHHFLLSYSPCVLKTRFQLFQTYAWKAFVSYLEKQVRTRKQLKYNDSHATFICPYLENKELFKMNISRIILDDHEMAQNHAIPAKIALH